MLGGKDHIIVKRERHVRIYLESNKMIQKSKNTLSYKFIFTFQKYNDRKDKECFVIRCIDNKKSFHLDLYDSINIELIREFLFFFFNSKIL